MLSTRLVSSHYWFGPGPLSFEEPFYSHMVIDIVEYLPEAIAQAVLAAPGARELSPVSPSWWEWEAVWEEGDRQILLDNLYLFEEASQVWAQLALTCDCQIGDLLYLWESIRMSCPAVWLYDENGQVLTPLSFLERWN